MRLFLVIAVLLPLTLGAQTFPLSEEAEISIITCGPYQQELYSAFGHSAIRVNDPANGWDGAYNYGVFDFNQPNFYLNFARGYLYYKLGVYDYQRFQDHYIYDNRYVHEQVLNLSPRQKQAVFDFLQWNALPENATYRYDYFYNNCATKMYEVVKKVLGDSVFFDGSYINTTYTIRDLTDLYIRKQQPWGDLGIDICLGLPMDKVASPLEYMFLPDYVEAGFDHAYLVQSSGTLPLVKKKNMIYESREEDPVSSLPHPLFFTVSLAVVAIALSVRDRNRKKHAFWFDAILFGSTGLIGFLLLFLWLFTDHDAASQNLNILWAFPASLFAVVFYRRSWVKPYFRWFAFLCTLLLATWFFLPQELHYALIPVVVALGVRAFVNYKLNLQLHP